MINYLLRMFIFLLGSHLFSNTVLSQIVKTSDAVLEEVSYSMSGIDKILISYNLIGAKQKEVFDIKVVVSDSLNHVFSIYSLSGDLKNVSQGTNKKILWTFKKDIANYSVDSINDSNIEQYFNIKLFITHANPKIIPYTSKAKAIAFSTLYPGAGSSRISQNKVHLLKGLAAYSCVALSIKYNIDGVDAYNSYQDELDPAKRNEYADKALEYQQLSNYFAYGAIAMWALDYINIMLIDNKTNNKGLKIAFKPVIQPQINGGLISIAYNF